MLTKPLETSYPLKIGPKWGTFTNSLIATDGADEVSGATKMCALCAFYVKYIVGSGFGDRYAR